MKPKRTCFGGFCTNIKPSMQITISCFWWKFVLHTVNKGIAVPLERYCSSTIRFHTTATSVRNCTVSTGQLLNTPHTIQDCHRMTLICLTERVAWRKAFWDCLATRPRSFYTIGIENLPKRWEKCIDREGNYMKK